MVQAVNVRICLQCHIPAGNLLTIGILFDCVSGGIQGHSGSNGNRGAVDTVHHRHSGASRNISLCSVKGILQTRQFISVDKPVPVKFFFQLVGKLIAFGFPVYQRKAN